MFMLTVETLARDETGVRNSDQPLAIQRLAAELPLVELYEMNSRVLRIFGQPLALGSAPTDSAERFRVHHAPVFGIAHCIRHV